MKWIERQRYFLDFTFSSLWRRKGKNLSLVAVYALVVFMVSSVIFFAGAIHKEAEAILEGAPDLIVQRTVAGRHDLIPMKYMEKIKTIRGVRSVKPRLWGYYYHPAARSNYTVMVPAHFSHGDGSVEIGHGVMNTWGAAQGDQLYFRAGDGKTITLKIVNTFNASTDLITSDLVLTSESTFRRLFGVPEGLATDLVMDIRNSREIPVIAEKIVKALPDTRPVSKQEILRTYASLFDLRSGYVVVLLMSAILAFLILAWDRATGLSAEEKSEIGILKAIGWDTSDVLAMKYWEGTVISLTAFVMGVIGAYFHVFIGSAPILARALKGWATLYPSFKLSPTVHADQLAVLFFLTVLPYGLFTMVPVWKLSVTDPDAAMRKG